MNRHAFITGGASGLGLGCATAFRRLGYALTLADIDGEAAQRAADQLRRQLPGPAPVRVEVVDLSNPASIAALGQRWQAQGMPIDVLVNNAGIYPPSQRRLTAEGHELSFAIAHLGHFRLSQALWPSLQAAPAARVVSISSMVQRQARLNLDDLSHAQRYEPIRAYQASKLACLLFAQELQRRLFDARSPIRSYAAHPGVCRTQIGAHRPRAADDRLWQRLSSAALQWGLRYVGQSPEAGAASVIAVATTERFAPGSLVGPRWLGESVGAPALSTLGPAARDADLALRLWARTEQITGSIWNPR